MTIAVKYQMTNGKTFQYDVTPDHLADIQSAIAKGYGCLTYIDRIINIQNICSLDFRK
jgi:hypothetical protein